MARIVSIATCVPPHTLDSAQTEELLRQLLSRWEQPPEFYLKVLRNTQIESRHTVFGPEQVINEHRLQERNDLYIRTCIELGQRCVENALADARLGPKDISSFISVSCTGYMIPAMDAHLLNRMGLSPNIRRTPITELGCVAGAVGLARAWEELQVYPDSNVLLLSVELPTLTFQRNDARAARRSSRA